MKMKWVKLMPFTILISSAYCVSLIRRTDKQALTDEIVAPLVDGAIKDVFSTPEESSLPSSSSELKSDSVDTIDDSPIDMETLDYFFGDFDIPSTTSSIPPVFSVNQRLKPVEESSDDLGAIDSNRLDPIFTADNNNTTDKASTTSSDPPPIFSVDERIDSVAASMDDFEDIDSNLLELIFSADNSNTTEKGSTTSSKPPPIFSVNQRTNSVEESLDDLNLLKLIFSADNNNTTEKASTTSSISPPIFSVNQRQNSVEESPDDITYIDPKLLNFIFPGDNHKTKELGSPTAKSTASLAATTNLESDSMDPAYDSPLDNDTLIGIFGPSDDFSSTDSTNEVLSTTEDAFTDEEEISGGLFSGHQLPLVLNTTTIKNPDNIDSRLSDGLNTTASAAVQPTVKKDSIILKYSIHELDPPLNGTEPSVPSRTNINNTSIEHTSSEETTDSSEYMSATVTEDPEETTSDYETEPIECAYNSTKFPIPKPEVNTKDRRVADIKCEEQMQDIKYNIYDVKMYELKCIKLTGRSTIIGGTASAQKQFPHMGAVGWFDTSYQPLFYCGTTLISSRFSVTAAHCKSVPDRGDMNVIDINPKFVRFGNVDITNTKKIRDVDIEKFLTLPEFTAEPTKKYNDIALIRFTEHVQFSDHLRPACLWHRPMDKLLTANVTGWGQTVNRDVGSRTNLLMYAEVNFVKHDDCVEQIGHRTNRHWQGLSNEQFCAGNLLGGGDTCQGDSGGPLQVQEQFEKDQSITVYHVVGITAFGFDCGKAQAPGIYTSVKEHLCFIEKNVWPSAINTFCD